MFFSHNILYLNNKRSNGIEISNLVYRQLDMDNFNEIVCQVKNIKANKSFLKLLVHILNTEKPAKHNGELPGSFCSTISRSAKKF